MIDSFDCGLRQAKLHWRLQMSSWSTPALGLLVLKCSRIWFCQVCFPPAPENFIQSLITRHFAGIGKFVIADEAIVRDEDLGVNFFLDEDCLGKPRALCCVNRLVELNPEVSGDWYPKEDVSSLEQRPATLLSCKCGGLFMIS